MTATVVVALARGLALVPVGLAVVAGGISGSIGFSAGKSLAARDASARVGSATGAGSSSVAAASLFEVWAGSPNVLQRFYS